jgi:hypothetical protein
VLLGGIAAGVVVVVAIVAVIVFAMTGRNNPAPAPAPTAAPATDSAMQCTATEAGGVVVGNGPGDTKTGPGAILGYWHAFFVDRNADLMHSFAAPNANLQPAPVLQATIDQQIPKGAAYCVTITTLSPNQYTVVVDQRDPDAKMTRYSELINTTVIDGKTLVELIRFINK